MKISNVEKTISKDVRDGKSCEANYFDPYITILRKSNKINLNVQGNSQ